MICETLFHGKAIAYLTLSWGHLFLVLQDHVIINVCDAAGNMNRAKNCRILAYIGRGNAGYMLVVLDKKKSQKQEQL